MKKEIEFKLIESISEVGDLVIVASEPQDAVYTIIGRISPRTKKVYLLEENIKIKLGEDFEAFVIHGKNTTFTGT